MSSHRYQRPARTVRVEHEVSRSRFIATLGRAQTMEQARSFLEAIRQEMPDANHHVYAIRVGHGQSVTEGMSDDGEPAGTSGPPALAVLRGSGLGDAVLVITRYFGGTKLGTGGLVSAYSEAARLAINAVEREERVDRVRFAVTLPYAHYERLKKALEDWEGIVEREGFGAEVLLQIAVPQQFAQELHAALADWTAGQVIPRRIDGN